jgi:hypothetical protein
MANHSYHRSSNFRRTTTCGWDQELTEEERVLLERLVRERDGWRRDYRAGARGITVVSREWLTEARCQIRLLGRKIAVWKEIAESRKFRRERDAAIITAAFSRHAYRSRP